MIFDLKDAATWDPVVRKILTSILGSSYPDTLKKNADRILYKDCDSDACDLFSDYANRDTLRAKVTKEICRNFKEVLTYHGCRPNRVEDYYEKGIVPLCPREIQNQFRDYFSAFFSHQDIDKAIAAVSLETRDGVVHVTLDDRDFVDGCGHYLIYGGEYQNCLAIHLPGASEHTRDILKELGKATILVCRLPFSVVNDLEYLVPFLMADHFFRIAHDRNDVNIIDYTIFLKEPIPPNAIVRHYRPVRIRDPYKNRAIWNDEIMEYEYIQQPKCTRASR
jgi:hypothetical protein